MIIVATTPDVDNFDCARDYAAWLGLTQTALHRRQAEGRPNIEDGNRCFRRLLYLGAMAQVMLRCRPKREP